MNNQTKSSGGERFTQNPLSNKPVFDEESPLLKGDKQQQKQDVTPVHLTTWWTVVHFLGFFTGGTTFIAGTTLYFFPNWTAGAWLAACLYTLGSIGFLSVDVLEFFTFTDNLPLRINISMSATGSTFYVIGSAGFIPSIYDFTPSIGIWGFILGSFFIGVSQGWKTYRIGQGDSGVFALRNLISSKDQFTQVGVESSAGIGAWCFFLGTIMYLHGPLDGAYYEAILLIWEAGSVFFTLGALFLGYRHFVMKV